MKIRYIADFLNCFAPLALQESYDNSGLIIGNPDVKATGLLICLDITSEVIREALKLKCNVIVSHHPVIFQPLKKITGSTVAEKMVMDAIRNNIAIISAHTNLDNIAGGVNGSIAEKLGLHNQKILKPQKGLLRKLVTFCPEDFAEKVRHSLFDAGAGQVGNYACCSYNTEGLGTFMGNDLTNPYVGNRNKLHFEPEIRIETIFPVYKEKSIIDALLCSHPYEEVAYDIYPLENIFTLVGSGLLGELGKEIPKAKFLKFVKVSLGTSRIRYTEGIQESIKKVAVCGGSGAFLLQEAIRQGADALITADIKYHDFQDASGQILLIDAGHYETEHHALTLLYKALSEKFSNFAIFITKNNTNPVQYL